MPILLQKLQTDILFPIETNHYGCHSTHFLGSKYAKNAFAAGAPPCTPPVKLAALLRVRPPIYIAGLGGHFLTDREGG